MLADVGIVKTYSKSAHVDLDLHGLALFVAWTGWPSSLHGPALLFVPYYYPTVFPPGGFILQVHCYGMSKMSFASRNVATSPQYAKFAVSSSDLVTLCSHLDDDITHTHTHTHVYTCTLRHVYVHFSSYIVFSH